MVSTSKSVVTREKTRTRSAQKLQEISTPHLSDPPQQQKQSLPDLTSIVEFLEGIQHLSQFVQRIAICFYAWTKQVDEQHLHRIASIRFERGEY